MDKRLQAVKSYLELLSTKDKTLEDFVYLASEICQTPIAAIIFVDDKKQYPVVGIGNVVETSCDIAFCKHTILQQHILEVTDAKDDPRFVNNPLVFGEPFIRFYAGIPLIASDGSAIGSLCAVDHRPRKLTEKQIKSLEILTDQVMQRLELLHNIHQLQLSVNEVAQKTELLEQAEVMKAAFYDNSEDCFLLLNTCFEIISFNKGTENFFRNREKPVELQKGTLVFDYLLPTNLPLARQMFHKVLEGETSSFEILSDCNCACGTWSKFTVSPTYNKSNELIGIACIGCNIDNEKNQQEKIRLQNSTLSQIAQLHAHQIRNPLTNILGIIHILKQQNFQMTKEYLGYLEDASNELDEAIRRVVLDSREVA